jgi:uncharacterized protein (TIGR02301 family)
MPIRAAVAAFAVAALFAMTALCATAAAAPRDPQADGGGAKANAAHAPAGKDKGAKTKPEDQAKPEPGKEGAAKSEPAKPDASNPQTPPEPPPPPYESRILRLAEILGALAYLDDVCGAKADWRARMQQFLEAEAKTADRKERLAGSFNRSFHDYELSYPSCTASAQVVISRFLSEGGQLARDVVNRFSAS